MEQGCRRFCWITFGAIAITVRVLQWAGWDSGRSFFEVAVCDVRGAAKENSSKGRFA